MFWTARLSESGVGDPVAEPPGASVYPGRSGDLIFLPKPFWVVASSGTHHGSAQAYDREVPVVFMGQGIVPGQYEGATPLDVAPTLAAIAGIGMPRADGKVRREVLAP